MPYWRPARRLSIDRVGNLDIEPSQDRKGEAVSMPEIFKKNVRRAAENVISFGDTDVFPFSFENILIRNQKEKFVDLIEAISTDFSKNVDRVSPQF